MKKMNKLLWIPIALVVVIAIAALVLSLVRVDPLEKNFGGYSYANYVQSSDGNEYSEVIEKELDKWLKTTDFSIMHAMLEGQFSYKLQLMTEKDENGCKVPAKLRSADIIAYGAMEQQYIIQLHYDEERTITVGDTKIAFDRVLLRIYETNGEIKEIECVPYVFRNVYNDAAQNEYDENGFIGSMWYETYVLTVKMNTSKLMSSLKDYLGD